jgi:hypothetical protein
MNYLEEIMKKVTWLASLGAILISSNALALQQNLVPTRIQIGLAQDGLAQIVAVGARPPSAAPGFAPFGTCNFLMYWSNGIMPVTCELAELISVPGPGAVGCLSNVNFATTVAAGKSFAHTNCSGFNQFGLLEPDVDLLLSENPAGNPRLIGTVVFKQTMPYPIGIVIP